MPAPQTPVIFGVRDMLRPFGTATIALMVAAAAPVSHQAKGTFDIAMTPDAAATGVVQHLNFTKRFHGALEATSVGQMLGVHTAVKGSAAYVVLEQVSGTLDGRTGSFMLQHAGTMAHGAAAATIIVVPDSGTGDLRGLTGAMTIDIVNGQHRYIFNYQL